MALTHIEYNSEGDPSSGFIEGGSLVFTAAAGPAKAPATKPGSVAPNKDEEMAAREWVPWGSGDDFPLQVMKQVRKSTVAPSALRLLVKMLYGQRVIPCRVVDFDPNTRKEKLEVVKDPKIASFLRRSNFNQWRIRVIQDYCYFANAFPMLIMTNDK